MEKREIRRIGFNHGFRDAMRCINNLMLNDFQIDTLTQLNGKKEFIQGWKNGQEEYKRYNSIR